MVGRHTEHVAGLAQLLLGVLGQRVASVPGDGDQPFRGGSAVLARAQGLDGADVTALAARLDEVGEQRVGLGPHRQVGADVVADDVVDSAWSVKVDTEQGGACAAAVGGDQIAGVDAARLLSLPVEQRRHDAATVFLLEGGQLLVGADPAGAGRVGVGVQQRVEPDLGKVGEPSMAGLGVPRGVCGTAPRGDLPELEAMQRRRAGDRGVPDDLAPQVVRRALGGDVVSHPHLVEDLHRPHVEQVCSRKAGLEPATLDQEHVDPTLGEQDRTGESDWPAPNDQDRDGLGPLVGIEWLEEGGACRQSGLVMRRGSFTGWSPPGRRRRARC